MMAYTHFVIEIVFLCSVVVLWVMIFYQLGLVFLGYSYRQKSLKEKDQIDRDDQIGKGHLKNLPRVSILIPAHNEALVIETTLKSMQSLNYPADRLEIIVINDGSTDSTADMVCAISSESSVSIRLFNVPPQEAAQGKSHALNLGLKQARYDLIAVYDADNSPEPDSLKYLVSSLLSNPKLVSVFGKFRTRNRRCNLLTRFINMETLAFQYMVQAGRYLLTNIAILPGTNFVIYKNIVNQCGGWDEKALTEDTELSIRLYKMGHEIKFVPYAVTWEEEPEAWAAWVKQRTRWVRGNFYVLKKYLIPSFRFKKKSLFFELVSLFILYYLFLIAILLSHLIFICSAMGVIAVLSPGPYFAVWICAFVLFVAEITLTASYENEATIENIVVISLMYFTYCQGWIILVFRALYQESVEKGNIKWEKTRRFGSGT